MNKTEKSNILEKATCEKTKIQVFETLETSFEAPKNEPVKIYVGER